MKSNLMEATERKSIVIETKVFVWYLDLLYIVLLYISANEFNVGFEYERPSYGYKRPSYGYEKKGYGYGKKGT